MNPKSLSIVLPTSNMALDLAKMLQSLKQEGVLGLLEELIIVNDGSTDTTHEVIREFENRNHDAIKIRHLAYPKSIGRYQARLKGAIAAESSHILFLDTRLELMPGLANELMALVNEYRVIQGTVEIRVEESVFNLYWDRSHRFLFSKHFRDQEKGFWLTRENFEEYTCGTTIFLCRKDIFLSACESFIIDPISDDRALIKKICEEENVWVTKKLCVYWWPRQSSLSFLQRLWERGQTFVEYHVIEQKTFLALPVAICFLILVFNLVLMLSMPVLFFNLFVVEFSLIMLSTIVFAKTFLEFVKMAPLHLGVVLVFGVSVLRGLVLGVRKNVSCE